MKTDIPPLLGYMAKDQYGNTFHLTKPKNPRKQLLEQLGFKSARRMFCDYKSGPPKQVGWIIGSHWLTVYEVRAFHKAA